MRRPRWLPLLAALLAFGLFSLLGTWQLQRAAEREAEWSALAAERGEAPARLPRGNGQLEALAWQRVRASGEFDGGRQFLLDNRTLAGEPGFVVLTPFRLGDGRTVLIERGWVAAERREPAESVRLPTAGEGELEITGRLWRPESGLALGPALAPVAGALNGDAWPRLTTRVDYAALEEALGQELVRAVIRPEADEPWTHRLRPLEPAFTPERHLGYAVQWYALALTVAIVTAVLVMGRRCRRSDE